MAILLDHPLVDPITQFIQEETQVVKTWAQPSEILSTFSGEPSLINLDRICRGAANYNWSELSDKISKAFEENSKLDREFKNLTNQVKTLRNSASQNATLTQTVLPTINRLYREAECTHNTTKAVFSSLFDNYLTYKNSLPGHPLGLCTRKDHRLYSLGSYIKEGLRNNKETITLALSSLIIAGRTNLGTRILKQASEKALPLVAAAQASLPGIGVFSSLAWTLLKAKEAETIGDAAEWLFAGAALTSAAWNGLKSTLVASPIASIPAALWLASQGKYKKALTLSVGSIAASVLANSSV